MNRRLFFQWLTGSAVVAGLPVVKSAESLILKPSDKLVISVDEALSHDTSERIRAEVERFAPGVPVLVLSGGMTLSTLNTEHIAEAVVKSLRNGGRLQTETRAALGLNA